MTDDSRFADGYYRSSDGLRLFFRDYHCQSTTNPDPVICLPGLTRNSYDFDELATLISLRRRVITTDLRGRGNSEHDPDRRNYHPAQYVADIWTLLDHLMLSRVVVVGTSLGGWMAMLMAYERPSAVAAVVMNDIGPEIDPTGIARVAAGAGTLPPVADWDEAVEQVSTLYAPTFPDWTRARWLSFAEKTYA
ncbi:MAG: alpha/beta hydrolase, partial [Gammaproteobacteria bacterium]|nr:alpha/beta hydrolase [Gammaproteobacteria bacterium]